MSCKCCGGDKPEIAIVLPAEITCEASIKRAMNSVKEKFPQFHFLTGRAMDGYEVKRVQVIPLPDQVRHAGGVVEAEEGAEFPSYIELPRIERLARALFGPSMVLVN